MKKKLTKKTNLELMNSVLTKIESYGYHIKDKEFGSCYFVFDGEDNSICHFHIKEIPGFLFGLWHISRYDDIKYQIKKNGIGHTWADSLNISPLTEIIFFTQYERDLNKFKPSQSGFVTGLFRECWEESDDADKIIEKEDWYDYQLENILEFMKKHPIRSSEYAGLSNSYIWENDSNGISIFYRWLKEWYYYYLYKLSKKLKLLLQINRTKYLLRKFKTFDYFLIDRGPGWSPRLDLFIRHKVGSNIKKQIKEQDKLNKFYDKWFNQMYIRQFDIDKLDSEMSEQDKEEDELQNTQFKQLWNNIQENQIEDNIKIILHTIIDKIN